jgi:hypothetical protein
MSQRFEGCPSLSRAEEHGRGWPFVARHPAGLCWCLSLGRKLNHTPKSRSPSATRAPAPGLNSTSTAQSKNLRSPILNLFIPRSAIPVLCIPRNCFSHANCTSVSRGQIRIPRNANMDRNSTIRRIIAARKIRDLRALCVNRFGDGIPIPRSSSRGTSHWPPCSTTSGEEKAKGEEKALAHRSLLAEAANRNKNSCVSRALTVSQFFPQVLRLFFFTSQGAHSRSISNRRS